MHLTLQGQHEHDEEMGLLDFGDGIRDGNRSGRHDSDLDDNDNVIYPEEFRICEVRLVSELSQNREQYIGEEFFTLSFCPNYISYNIDRIRAYTHEKDNYQQPQPGAFVAMSAAIHWGLRVLIRSLMQLRCNTRKERQTMTTYNGYEIHSTCGKVSLFWISRNGKDLFFGIKSREDAKRLIDNWIIARPILSR